MNHIEKPDTPRRLYIFHLVIIILNSLIIWTKKIHKNQYVINQ